jgi:streptogramin lyase
VWDVLAHPNGRVYFTDFYGASGYVEPATGRVVRFDVLGSGLNELALGRDGQILATRYASERDEQGSVVVLDTEGALLAEHVLSAPEGWRVAPKSIAWDPCAARSGEHGPAPAPPRLRGAPHAPARA